MTRYQTDVATAHASRYLQQLCKHWSHRLEVAFDATQGVVRFDGATCNLRAAADRLHVTLESDDLALATTLCGVVADHLKRFAFREDLGFDWTEVPVQAGAER
ncbi:DUF2218 domain-containing protein [Pelagibius sp. 7325]|uniref:DUF2218 domain-containing protein n=1 Tax=Pelagibius sp. 7325 TaxID=3131994 RepID=UPI0030EEF89B